MTETLEIRADAVLDRHAATPLYEQVCRILRDGIDAGRGTLLPSEAALQRRFGISRVTARQALRKLVDEGLIETRQGKGTFVSRGRVRHQLDTPRGFYDELLCQGVIPETTLTAFGARAPRAPGLSTYLERRYLVDGEPLAVVASWLPDAALALGEEVAAERTIYGIVEQGLGHRIARVETTISAGQASAPVAASLALGRGGFALVLLRRSFDEQDALCEISAFHVRPDRYEFVVTAQGPLAGVQTRARPPG
ncbi:MULTISPECIES: GntR family transcriptional regulator [Cupriavidus]